MNNVEDDKTTRRQFLEHLLTRAHDNGFPLHDDGSLGGKDKKAQSLYAGAGERNVGYHYWLSPGQDPYISLSIYDAKERSRNQALFDNLRQHQSAIEEAFGEPLTWERVIPNNLVLRDRNNAGRMTRKVQSAEQSVIGL